MNTQLRSVETDEGTITYTVTWKQVRRLNLRLNARGEVLVSVPYGCPAEGADAFVRRVCGWIAQRLRRKEEERNLPLLPELNRGECVALLEQSVIRMLPLVAPMGVTMPEIRVRKMTSWGVCHWSKGYITLNVGLHRCPEPLRDYVALHELVHFLHHDHGKGFRGTMDSLMPDWRARQKGLYGYGTALNG